MGTFKVLLLLPTDPIRRLGGETPNHFKNFFKLPQQHVPKSFWQLLSVGGGGLVKGKLHVHNQN